MTLDTCAVPDWPLPIAWLPAHGVPQQLVLLLHAWASDAQAMQPLAQALRAHWPQAAILAPQAPMAADGGRRGYQWYSIEGLGDPQVWAARVDDRVAQLQPWVRVQQLRLGVGAQATALAGFSQGGILSLALAHRQDGICGRVLSFGGCLVRKPTQAPQHTTLHLFHGGNDKRIETRLSHEAMQCYSALGADATLDIAEGVGHELHRALIERALHRLQTHIPQRTWRQALGAGQVPRVM